MNVREALTLQAGLVNYVAAVSTLLTRAVADGRDTLTDDEMKIVIAWDANIDGMAKAALEAAKPKPPAAAPPAQEPPA
jgi:hypothetical protein